MNKLTGYVHKDNEVYTDTGVLPGEYNCPCEYADCHKGSDVVIVFGEYGEFYCNEHFKQQFLTIYLN